MDMQGYLPIIVVLCVAGFFLGNMFAAKPKAHEVRTADFRLLARKFGFNPKLITKPDWLPAKKQDASHHAVLRDFVATYAVICDDWRLPLSRFVMMDGIWQALDMIQVQFDADSLPKEVADNAIGLQFKANSVVLYWQDSRYQASQGVHKLDKNRAEQDLQALKQALNAWGDAMNAHQKN